MAPPDLDGLARKGFLKAEAPLADEFDGLLESAARRLQDAGNEALSLDGRFDLAYNAAHALALAALRWHGFRPERRYMVFQVLETTVGLPAAKWRVLARCHEERNRIEYEGLPNLTKTLVAELLAIARELRELVQALPPIAEKG